MVGTNQFKKQHPTSHIRERTASEIISNAFGLYFHNFWLFLSIYIGPLIAFNILANILAQWLALTGGLRLLFIVWLPIFTVWPIAQAMITVAISDLWLGNRPSLGRCVRATWARIGSLVAATLMVGIATGIGSILLFVPGVIALIMLLFTSTIVIIERRGAWEAMRRSVQLGRGFYWRNFGIILLVQIIVIGASFLVDFVLLGGPDLWGRDLIDITKPSNLISQIVSYALVPPLLVTFVLLYYDMRIRKENYDTARLAQDLF